MCSKLLIGCSGWNYDDSSYKAGWLNVLYSDKKHENSYPVHNSSTQLKWILRFTIDSINL
ncbi:MAG TPA: hypothetical protein VJR94_06175 [Candidatus Nitrosocosmicus sp.]|nr:hypothetical protein [Candidatus Nitrosocosmicus sp.]